MRILIGLIGCALSLLLIIYRVPVRQFMGQIEWAEAKLGPGGTYTALVLVGILGFFFSITYMTDAFGVIFGESPTRFFNSVK